MLLSISGYFPTFRNYILNSQSGMWNLFLLSRPQHTYFPLIYPPQIVIAQFVFKQVFNAYIIIIQWKMFRPEPCNQYVHILFLDNSSPSHVLFFLLCIYSIFYLFFINSFSKSPPELQIATQRDQMHQVISVSISPSHNLPSVLCLPVPIFTVSRTLEDLPSPTDW